MAVSLLIWVCISSYENICTTYQPRNDNWLTFTVKSTAGSVFFLNKKMRKIFLHRIIRSRYMNSYAYRHKFIAH